jgi:hypothetical protein
MDLGSLKIEAVAKSFFDREAVQRVLSQKLARGLSRFGSYVMTGARGRIRKRKKPSKPGASPTNWTGALKQNIVFAADLKRKSVVIGPIRINGRSSGTAPSILEHGGTIVAEGTQPAKRYSLGDFAVLRAGGRKTKLLTEAQVALANRLAPRPLHGVTIQPRPYMKPAFDKELGKLAEIMDKS